MNGDPYQYKKRRIYIDKLPFSHSIDVSGLVRYSTIRDDGMQWDGW